MFRDFFKPPWREIAIIILVSLALIIYYLYSPAKIILFIAALIGSLFTFVSALKSIYKRRVTIDTLNAFALIVSFAVYEYRSAAFIVLMLSFANILDWKTESRSKHAVEELLRLKPEKAVREIGKKVEEVAVSEIHTGDIVVVESGSRIPVDGFVIFGQTYVNESPVTGESLPVHKVVGDSVYTSTLNESGVIKVRADKVGADSTIEKMAKLIKEAAQNKSKSEKLADKFAAMFLPILILVGSLTYLITRNVEMTVALFLVACADDMALSIPLAMTAALGRAAKRGVIVKGGRYLEVLGKIKTLVLDKTGTLTYGSYEIRDVRISEEYENHKFWKSVGIAEKFSEHPAGRALYRKALSSYGEIPDPEEIKVYEGSGIKVRYKGDEIIVGDFASLLKQNIKIDEKETEIIRNKLGEDGNPRVVAIVNGKYVGSLTVADIPRKEARETIELIRSAGVEHVVMFTGDTPAVAEKIAKELGIDTYLASLKPEDKLNKLEDWKKYGPVAMVGDGINDAPALAKASVGIAMGKRGTAVAVEAADIVILTDDLGRIPELIELGRDTFKVIKVDIIIWVITNIFGFILVFAGIAGPVFAAFYNFIGDFLPIINSSQLFRENKKS
jgi:P-type Cu+ transporter